MNLEKAKQKQNPRNFYLALACDQRSGGRIRLGGNKIKIESIEATKAIQSAR